MHADSRKLKVRFNYEFLEDFQEEQSSDKQSSDEEGGANIDTRYTLSSQIFLSSLAYLVIVMISPPTVLSPGSRRNSPSTLIHFFLLWVALCFWSCSLAVNLILIFQKKHGCSDLMKHPLVISLLDYKWKKFGRCIFFGNLFIYLIFLAFLTAFGLVVLSPVERPCKHILYKIFVCAWVK